MPKLTSRADRIGFIVLLALAAILAAFLVTNVDDRPAEVATGVSPFADIPAADPAPAQPVATTEAVAMPTATPIPAAAPAAASLVDQVDAMADEDTESSDEIADDATEGDTGPTVDDGASDATTTASETAATGDAAGSAAADTTATTAGANAAAGGAASDPEPTATEVPNPQLPADADTDTPNPQLPADADTDTPNPQLPADADTDTPNPQPATAAVPVSAPADAPAGGTFTHTLTATVSQPTLHTSAGGPTFMPTFNGTALPPVNPTVFGNPLVYRVLAGAPGDAWAKVYVPARPNGTTAWVQTSQFNWGSSNRMLQINVSNNTVTVFEGSNVLLTTSAVTGKSSSPTPLANGWVEEIMAGPSAAYGPTLISLGIFSDALNSFGGSVPKVALHGTSSPGLMGQYASNGCIRVRNEIITQIAGMLPVGSKVIITG